MIFKNRIEIFILFAIFAFSSLAAICPVPNRPGTIFSGINLLILATLLAALDLGSIPLEDGQDNQCYNYSLPYLFNWPPDVAISLHDFEA